MSDEQGSGAGRAAAHRQEPIYVAKAEFFRVLGHPARVRILELLRDGERGVGELQAALNLDSSGTSQHLGVLRRQGLDLRDGMLRGLRDEGLISLEQATPGGVYRIVPA